MRKQCRTVVATLVIGLGGLLTGTAEAAPCIIEPTDMSLAYGDLISCAISPATDTDLYRVGGIAGDRMLVEAGFVSGAGFAPRIQLFAPDGTSLGVASNPPRLDVILPQTGTYTVSVFNAFVTNATPGEYTFVVSCAGGSCVPNPPTPPSDPFVENIGCETEPTDQFLPFGTRVNCDVAPATDIDVYRFTGSAGDRILAESGWVSGAGFAPRIQIFAPDGTSLGTESNPPRLDLVLAQSGTYTAIVFNAFVTNATPGSYTFTVSCTGGSCVPPPGKLPSLTLTLTGCKICHPGDQFTVQANFKNPASKTINTELKFGVRIADGTPFNLLPNKHLETAFPAGLNSNSTLLTFIWPTGFPLGVWTVEATLLGPDLGDTFSRAVKTFTSAP